MKFDYTVTTTKTVNEALAAVEKETQAAGFSVLTIHDVQATLAKKGFTISPFKIVEICQAKSAYTVLQADTKLGLCLPCKINIYVKDNTTYISALRPGLLSQLFPKVNLGNLTSEIDQSIREIVDRSK